MAESNTLVFLQLLFTFLGSLVASSGFWLYVAKKQESKDVSKKLLMGLAHDRIIYLTMSYIARGSITQEEHENLCQFLYEPYKEIGGNGSATRFMEAVNNLPITKEISKPIQRRSSRKNVSVE